MVHIRNKYAILSICCFSVGPTPQVRYRQSIFIVFSANETMNRELFHIWRCHKPLAFTCKFGKTHIYQYIFLCYTIHAPQYEGEAISHMKSNKNSQSILLNMDCLAAILCQILYILCNRSCLFVLKSLSIITGVP